MGTHKLNITVVGSNIVRQWYRLSDGSLETDPGVIAALEARLGDDCATEPVFSSEQLDTTVVPLPQPTFPAGLKEITVYNSSALLLEVDTSAGTQLVPPYTAVEFGVDDTDPDITLNALTTISGAGTANDVLVINYRAEQ